MDDTFPIEFWHNDHFWLDAPISVPVSPPTSTPAATQISAFVPYDLSRPATGLGQDYNNATTTTATVSSSTSYDSRNVNKRMIEYWRKHWHEKKELPVSVGDLEREKCHRHMLNERIRREKQKQSYLALHSMLPKNTKNDKNSIVQSAARTILEMKGLEKTLKRRNSELEMAIATKKKENEKGIINVALANTSCGINSMLTVLNVLKTVGVNSKAIHATFFNSQFSAQLAIDTHMGAAEVERALQLTLNEADRKFQRQYNEGSKEIKESYFLF